MTTPARQPLPVHGDESLSAYGPARATAAGTPLRREDLRPKLLLRHEASNGSCRTHIFSGVRVFP